MGVLYGKYCTVERGNGLKGVWRCVKRLGFLSLDVVGGFFVLFAVKKGIVALWFGKRLHGLRQFRAVDRVG